MLVIVGWILTSEFLRYEHVGIRIRELWNMSTWTAAQLFLFIF